MEKISIERIVHIVAFLYKSDGEVVADYGINKCYLYFNVYTDHLEIEWEETEFLVDNDILDLDSGCEECEHKTMVFKLSSHSILKIQNLIRNRKQNNLFET